VNVATLEQTYTLQSDEAIKRWDEIEPLLARIDTNTSMEFIRAAVANKDAQVWAIGTPLECVILTRIEDTDGKRYGLLWLGAGDLRIVDAISGIIENWFRSMDCQYVQIVGRRGWKKHFPDYEERSVNMVKNLWPS